MKYTPTAAAVAQMIPPPLPLPLLPLPHWGRVRGHGTQLGWRILELHKAYLEAQAQRAQHHDTGSTAKGYSPRHRAAHVQLLGRHRPERENICRLRGSANLNGKHLLFGSRPSHLPYAQVELADDGMRLNPFYTKLIHASCQCKHWRNF